MSRVPKGSIKNVLDIGSGDGKFLQLFRGQGCRVIGFEGSSDLCSVSSSKGIYTVNSLFDENAISLFESGELFKPDLITLLHTFDHIPRPHDFFKAISSILPLNGMLLIEVHSLDKMIENCEGAVFGHEHTSYYSHLVLQESLRLNGFNVVDANFIDETYMIGASQIVLAQKVEPYSATSANVNASAEAQKVQDFRVVLTMPIPA